MLFANDEHDTDRDDDIDADDEKDSEEQDDSEDEDEDIDADDSDDSDEDDEEDEDNKPVTRKELREMLQGKKNARNAADRVSKKNGRDTRQPSETDKRLEALEKKTSEALVLEKKRTFGYENNLSPKQVNYVFRLTKRPTASFLAKPHVKAALDAIKAQDNVSRNTPTGSGKRPRGSESKKWTELKPEERQASLADRRREILASKGR